MKNNLLKISLLGCALHSASNANEALDLLEGRITEDEVTVTELLKPSEEEVALEEAQAAAEEEARVLRDTRDYSGRWKEQLTPLGVVYEDEGNTIIQRIAIDGLVEYGLTNGDLEADQGGSTDGGESRLKRARLGAMVQAFYNTDLEARVVADDDGYQGIDTLKATIEFNEALELEVGKFRAPFGQDFRLDPNVRHSIGLSRLSTQLSPGNTLGVQLNVYDGPWDFGLGYYSGDLDENLPGLERGFVLANIGYTLLGASAPNPEDENARVPPGYQRWYLDYIFNTDPDNSENLAGVEHLLSTGVATSAGRFDFDGEFILANGPDTSAWGLNLVARHWLLEDAIRLVGRYSYADSDDPGGIFLGLGVEGAEGDTTQALAGFDTVVAGDELHSFYLGLDWHILQDYLLITTGLEYTFLGDDTNGDSDLLLWHSGARLAF